ncbi:MAG: LysR family transcriptional regulator [Cellvibrionaceae bacterium]
MKNPITIEALQVIDTIDRRGSFAKASEELNKVPSALSYIVQRLEEQLGVTLFQRQGRRSILTPAGRTLLNEGRNILTATELLIEKTKEVATGWEPKLNLGIEGTANPPQIFSILKQFLDTHPQVEVDIQETVLNGGWEALEQDKIDLLIGAPPPQGKPAGLRLETIAMDKEMVLVASPSLPVSQLSRPVAIDHPLLLGSRKVVIHDSSISGIKQSRGLLDGSAFFYVQTLEQKIEAQLAGIGIGRLPKARIQHHLNTGLLIEIDIDEPTAAVHALMAWKISKKGKALRALTELILQYNSK